VTVDHEVWNAHDHGLAGDGVTNDQPALQELVDAIGDAVAADRRARVIYCPPGVYSIRDAGTVWRSGVSLIGAGPAATRFELANPGNPGRPAQLALFTTDQHGAGRDNHIADCTFARFEIDGSGVALDEYDVLAKGLGLQYVLRGRFRDLYIHDTGATGFGCDFLQDSFVQEVVAVGCGRLDNGEQMGGAGIGIGIGGWGMTERLTVSGCTAAGNATNGIFVELQKEYWPPTRGIRIADCHVEHNRYGISDWGADGMVVSGCTMTGNFEAGFDVSSQGTSSVGGRGGILTACVIDMNVRDGVSIGNTPGPYTVRGNRISNNGRFGYHEHNLEGGDDEPAREIAIDGNDVFGNALDGVHIDASMTDAALVGNRIRNNGSRAAPADEGAGDSVTYEDACLTDNSKSWPEGGHRGKTVTVGDRTAAVVANTDTQLLLAPNRPGAPSAWDGATPSDGTPYSLPGAPAVRAGIAIAAALERPMIHANRVWDNQERPTQTHGIWIADGGACHAGRVRDNDLTLNALAAVRFDTEPDGGHWRRNLGL
jgi:hypothetical protein